MAYRFFQIPARGCPETESDLNQLLRNHRVLHVDRRWIELGENSYWAICVDFLDAASNTADTKASRKGVDYRELLSADDFAVYSDLRQWRKTIANQEGVPVYQVFTNEQLAKIVQDNVRGKTALGRIPGLGEARVAKYADALLDFLKQRANGQASLASEESDETSG